MDESAQSGSMDHLELAVEMVAAYVSNNSLPATDLPSLISSLHGALSSLAASSVVETPAIEKVTPAQARKSVSPDHLVSFEDGKPYKTLRRHLTLRGLTPEAYREKWGLPRDYPMTAASYSAQRSELARTLGLGQQRRKGVSASTPSRAVAEVPAAPAKTRGRKKGAAPASAE